MLSLISPLPSPASKTEHHERRDPLLTHRRRIRLGHLHPRGDGMSALHDSIITGLTFITVGVGFAMIVACGAIPILSAIEHIARRRGR